MTNYNNLHNSASCLIHDSITAIENLSHKIIDVANEKSIPIINDFFKVNLDTKTYTYPNYQMKINDNQILVYIEIPGVKKENCQIVFKRGELVFKGESTHQESFDFIKPLNYIRHIKIPINVESENVSAIYENGVN